MFPRTLVWVFTLFVGFFLGCTTAEVANLDYPLADVKSMTTNFFNKVLREDEAGGRDYTSAFFRPNLTKGQIETPRTEDQVRARAKVRFVGNERPYTVVVRVEVESKEGNTWFSEGEDRQLSKKVSKLLAEFIQTRRDKNFIDHFRSF